MIYILRRKGASKPACDGLAQAMIAETAVLRSDRTLITEQGSAVFRWGCTATLPSIAGFVVNTAGSIHWCNNKARARLAMQEAGVSVPETWGDPDPFERTVLGTVGPQIFIVRPVHHTQGRNMFVGGWQDAVTAWHGFGGGYISRLIPKVAEYRVMVIQNRIAWVAQKIPEDSTVVAWNHAQGSSFRNVRWGEWPLEVIKEALAAASLSGTSFSAVDVIVDSHNKAYVLELNTAPSLDSPYRLSCVAKCFDHIVSNGKVNFDDVVGSMTWKKAIHTAVKGE